MLPPSGLAADEASKQSGNSLLMLRASTLQCWVCRKDLWNKWVTQLVRELNDPAVAAAAKALKGGSSRGAERDRERQAKEAGIDKAYHQTSCPFRQAAGHAA